LLARRSVLLLALLDRVSFPANHPPSIVSLAAPTPYIHAHTQTHPNTYRASLVHCRWGWVGENLRDNAFAFRRSQSIAQNALRSLRLLLFARSGPLYYCCMPPYVWMVVGLARGARGWTRAKTRPFESVLDHEETTRSWPVTGRLLITDQRTTPLAPLRSSKTVHPDDDESTGPNDSYIPHSPVAKSEQHAVFKQSVLVQCNQCITSFHNCMLLMRRTSANSAHQRDTPLPTRPPMPNRTARSY
jgi:hypothetical protein